jgi:hypothetical protein
MVGAFFGEANLFYRFAIILRGGVHGFVAQVEDAPLLGDEIFSPKLQKRFTASSGLMW